MFTFTELQVIVLVFVTKIRHNLPKAMIMIMEEKEEVGGEE
jgi:hypothetical protein